MVSELKLSRFYRQILMFVTQRQWQVEANTFNIVARHIFIVHTSRYTLIDSRASFI